MQDTTQSNTPVVTGTELEVERLAREVAELRATVESLQTDGPRRNGREARRCGDDLSLPPKRRLGRRGHGAREPDEPSSLVSRRRLFGLLGGATAVGVGGALLASSPSGATSGGNLVIDGSAATNGGTGTTNLSSTTTSTAMVVAATGTNGSAISGAAKGAGIGVLGSAVALGNDTGTGVRGEGSFGPGVFATSGSGNCLEIDMTDFTGPGVPLFIRKAPTPGGGPYALGSFWLEDPTGNLLQCVVPGSPGTWINLSSPLLSLPSPARVYDSRVGQLPATAPKSQITNGNTVSVDVTGPQAAGGNSGVPLGAKSVVGNITVVNGPNPVFLTVFAEGDPPPATSNVNAAGGVVVANSFNSKLGGNGISIKCGGGPTDFIIDIFGYYP